MEPLDAGRRANTGGSEHYLGPKTMVAASSRCNGARRYWRLPGVHGYHCSDPYHPKTLDYPTLHSSSRGGYDE